MAQARYIPPGCEDLQVQVMKAVDLAISDAGTQLCIRDGTITGAEARWFLAEAAVVSLFASIANANPDAMIFEVAGRLAREAVDYLAKGRAVPLDQVTDGGGVKG